MASLMKQDFEYARLYTPTGEYCGDPAAEGLLMGPETKKRYDENADGCAVTVCCITYHHEQFIRSALDGFVMQKTNFKFKVFVGEDCGGDGTAEIIREYAEQYPDLIVPFIRERNMGAQANLVDLCNRAHSPYVAFCEGDDYWTDEYKLQKQFDYMQAHKDIRLCYTRTKISAPENWHLNGWFRHDENGDMILPGCTPGFPVLPEYTAADFIMSFPTHTSSVFYRWDYDLVFPEWFFKGIIGDMPVTLLQLGLGKAVYLPDVTSVYRRSDVGVFMSGSTTEHFARTRLDYLRFLGGLRQYFGEHFGGYAQELFLRRMALEIMNYINTAVKLNDGGMLSKLASDYPLEALDVFALYMRVYKAYHTLPGDLQKLFSDPAALKKRLEEK